MLHYLIGDWDIRFYFPMMFFLFLSLDWGWSCIVNVSHCKVFWHNKTFWGLAWCFGKWYLLPPISNPLFEAFTSFFWKVIRGAHYWKMSVNVNNFSNNEMISIKLLSVIVITGIYKLLTSYRINRMHCICLWKSFSSRECRVLGPCTQNYPWQVRNLSSNW